jgi:peptide/nickel transport system permease protein
MSEKADSSQGAAGIPATPDPRVAAGSVGSLTGPVDVPATSQAEKPPSRAARGYRAEVWRRYRRNSLGIIALAYVAVLSVVAVLSPALIGTKPVVCRYQGRLYMPCLGYFYEPWEDRQHVAQELRKRYSPARLKAKDPESWAIWPAIFQDPFRRVRADEWPGRPGNPSGNEGRPSRQNLLGTTQTGVDVLAQLIHGTRVALLVGFVSTGIAGLIGITLGALAGFYGGWIDILLSRMIEVMMCIPALVLILALLAVVDKATIWHTMAVLGITGWTSIARLMRAEFLKLRSAEYAIAARALGSSQARVMFRHILPNALAPVLVPIAFGIASAILIENALSFLGFGSPPPNASWGNLLSAGQRSLSMWWLILFPGLAIFLTVLAYNLIGEGLQEATDPRLRESAK